MGLNITLDEFCQMRAAEENKQHFPYEEGRAGELLTFILRAARWEPRDLPGANNMHDLDVVLGDGARIAVEVTSDTDGKRASLVSETDHDDKNPIVANSLKRYWHITPGPEARVDHLLDGIEPILHEAEQTESADPIVFVLERETDTESNVCEKLRALEIEIAQGVCTDDPEAIGRIWLQPPSTEVSWFCMEDLAMVAAEGIERKVDKVLKAKNHGAEEAHLFIWLNGTVGHSAAAWAQSMSPPLPGQKNVPIDLRELDSVWLVSSSRFAGLKEDVRGQSNPVWQYSHDQWVCHERVWQERRLDV